MANILDITMGGKRFVDVTSQAFRVKLVQIASRLGLDPSALATVMMFETGKTISPSIRNPYSGATGLIQFMPSTARNMGTTTDALAKMSAVEQLDWVEKYFTPYRNRLKTPHDHYLAVFMPSLIGTSLDHIAASNPTPEYVQNKGFDTSGKGYFTTGDVVGPVTNAYYASQKLPTIYVPGMDWATPVRRIGLAFLSGMAGAVVGYSVAWSTKEIGITK